MVCSKLNNGPPNIQVLMLGKEAVNVTLYGKRNLEDAKDYPGLFSVP